MPCCRTNFAARSNYVDNWVGSRYVISDSCGQTVAGRISACALLLISAVFLQAAFAQSSFGPSNYNSAIEQAENELGAYNFAVVEPAIGLGLDLQKNNLHAEAVEALERALHVNRVNKGLHHLDHVPIVDLLVHSHLQLGDWESAAQQHRLRFWIHRRELQSTNSAIDGPSLNRFVDASIHFANWQSKSHLFETGNFPLHQLREAQYALSDARQLLQARNRASDDRYFKVLNAAAVNSYNIVVYLSNNEVDPVSGSYAGDQDISDYLLRQNIINENYHAGTESLTEVVALTANAAPGVRHAMAKLNYANWQLLFNRPQTAKKEYANAFAAFIESGLDRQAVNTRLAEPERISTFSLDPLVSQTSFATMKTVGNEQRQEAPVEQAYALAIFDVTRTGEVRNVEIKSWPKDNRRIRREARGRLAFSKFRPALIDGKPVAKKDMQIRYVFPQANLK